MTFAPSAQAEGSGAETLLRARAAWDKGEFDSAEPLYKEALDRGSLAPKETLDAIVHLGSARAVMGRKKGALVAFRQAALIDPQFAVPTEAGKRATLLAIQARREQSKIGPYVLKAEIPDTAPANKPFRVTASLDATHAALVARMAVVAKEPITDKSFEKADAASTAMAFEIPASVAAGDQTVTVRVDALDPHDNRLVSVEKRVKIDPAPAEPAAVAAAPAAAPTPDGDSTTNKAAASAWSKPIPDAKSDKDQGTSKGGGFWSSPWPYVIGGVALAAGGAAVYLATRPTDDVSVGGASVRTVR